MTKIERKYGTINTNLSDKLVVGSNIAIEIRYIAPEKGLPAGKRSQTITE